MGTRHLICVVKDGEYKVAQYGQWDGYPEGQGLAVLEFVRLMMEYGALDEFKQKLDNVYFATEEELKAQWNEAGADPNSEWVDMEVSEKHREMFPQNSRDTGAKILAYVMVSQGRLGLFNDINFAGDSLFCEWAYVIDLDKMTLEVYAGFNHEKLAPDERFYSIPAHEHSALNDEYYQVRFVKSYDINDLPDNETFVKEIHELTDDEEEDDSPIDAAYLTAELKPEELEDGRQNQSE